MRASLFGQDEDQVWGDRGSAWVFQARCDLRAVGSIGNVDGVHVAVATADVNKSNRQS